MRIRRLTVEADYIEPLEPVHPEGYLPCNHEVTWFSTADWIERCAICGEVLGTWKGKPKA